MRLARLLVAVLPALILTGCQTSEDSRGYMLPPGDAAAGRQAFLELRCHTCHPVIGSADIPQPVIRPPAPTMDGDVGRMVSGTIATSIVVPSHAISSRADHISHGDTSLMGDYTQTMTVRQLIDLVGFIKSLAGSESGT